MSAASAQPAGRKQKATKKRQKVAIIGYTQHNYEAPWQDDSWDFLGLNDLHRTFEQQVPGFFKTDRVQWFQLHRRQPDGQYPGARDPEHTKWLTTASCPVWMWQHDPEIPTSVPYPLLEVLNLKHPTTGDKLFPEAYFNNSISWQIAWAIYHSVAFRKDGYHTIGLYGVDMAMDGVHGESEYAFQRPSVEFMIGVARGLGIKVVMPQVSEVLKCAFLYGYDNETHLRKKLLQRVNDLQVSEAHDVDQYETFKRLLFQIKGAIMFLTGEGVAGDVLMQAANAIPDELRAKTIETLKADEANVTNNLEGAKRSLHETRGALHNCKWTLRNYLPGEGPLQDVPRADSSLTAAEVDPTLVPSDGTAAGGVNRIMNLVKE